MYFIHNKHQLDGPGKQDLVIGKNHDSDSLKAAYQSYKNPPSELVSKLIEIGGRELVMKKDRNGDNVLIVACRSSNRSSVEKVVSKLIENGGKDLVIGKDFCHGTNALLTVLTSYKSTNPLVEVVSKLIEIGGKELVLGKNYVGDNALMGACQSAYPSLEVITKLIEIGGRELVMKSNYRGNALTVACRSPRPSFEVISKLIEIGGRDVIIEKDDYGCHALVEACWSSNPSLEVITKLIEVAGKDCLTRVDYQMGIPYPRTVPILCWVKNLSVIKVLISEGVRLQLGGEFGVGGLFNSCSDNRGHPAHNHHAQKKINEQWFDAIAPILEEDTTKVLLCNQPILHAAIISKAPCRIIQDIINRFPGCLSFQDSMNRYPLDVAVQEGLAWDDGLKIVVEAFAAHISCSVIHVAAYHGVEWENGMREVVEENEKEIGIVDVVTGLYPFMLTAVGGTRSSDLNSIFNIMKKEPGLV